MLSKRLGSYFIQVKISNSGGVFRISSPCLTVIMLRIWQQHCLGCIPESPNMFQTVQCQLLIL